MSNLSELEQRKRELELKRDIRRLERGVAVSDAVATAKEKAPRVGRLVLKWGAYVVGALVLFAVVAAITDTLLRG